MSGAVPVVVDFERGEVRFGLSRVRIEGTARPHRFRLATGGIVRAISFGERSRLVKEALAGNDPAAALVDLLQSLALEGTPDEVATAVLLSLAGGAEAAPGFDACAVETCRVRGWDWRTLNDTPAIEVDRSVEAAHEISFASPSRRWTRFVFQPAENEGESSELARAIQEMTDRLLERAEAVGERNTKSAPSSKPTGKVWGQQPSFKADGVEENAGGSQYLFAPWNGVREAPPHHAQQGEPLAHGDATAPVSARSDPRLRGPEARKSEASSPASESRRVASSDPVVARARFRLRPSGVIPDTGTLDRKSGLQGQPGEPMFQNDERRPLLAHFSNPTSPIASRQQWESDSGIAPVDAVHMPAIERNAPLDSGLKQESRDDVLKAHRPSAPPPSAMPSTDWLDEIARALADECDLRGID